MIYYLCMRNNTLKNNTLKLFALLMAGFTLAPNVNHLLSNEKGAQVCDAGDILCTTKYSIFDKESSSYKQIYTLGAIDGQTQVIFCELDNGSIAEFSISGHHSNPAGNKWNKQCIEARLSKVHSYFEPGRILLSVNMILSPLNQTKLPHDNLKFEFVKSYSSFNELRDVLKA